MNLMFVLRSIHSIAFCQGKTESGLIYFENLAVMLAVMLTERHIILLTNMKADDIITV